MSQLSLGRSPNSMVQAQKQSRILNHWKSGGMRSFLIKCMKWRRGLYGQNWMDRPNGAEIPTLEILRFTKLGRFSGQFMCVQVQSVILH
jgi:hypothetical protein